MARSLRQRLDALLFEVGRGTVCAPGGEESSGGRTLLWDAQIVAEAVGVPAAAESPEPAEPPAEPEASAGPATGRGTDLFELFDKGARAEAS